MAHLVLVLTLERSAFDGFRSSVPVKGWKSVRVSWVILLQVVSLLVKALNNLSCWGLIHNHPRDLARMLQKEKLATDGTCACIIAE